MVDFAVILAIGSLSHQSQLTYNRSRVMLPVLGKPMVARTMERLIRAGIQNYVVIVGEDEGAVAAYLNSHWLTNVHIEFLIQSPSSSLTRTLADIARRYRKPFLLTAYNTFVHANFPEHLLSHYEEYNDCLLLTGAPTTLSKSMPHAFAKTTGQIVTAIIREQSAQDADPLALASLAICGSNFVDFLSNLLMNTGIFSKQLPDIFQLYIQAGRRAFIAETSWLLQVEADYDLLTLNRYLLDDGSDTHILSELPPSVQVIPPVRIDPQVSVGQGTRIGPRVYLEAGCSIGHHVTVTNAIVLQNAVIPAGSHVSDAIISTRKRIENPDKS